MNAIPPPTERIRLRRTIQHRPSLQARIRRRARILALIERERLVDAMVAELYLGRLNEDEIDTWEPVRGTSTILERLYVKIGNKRTDT